MHIKWLNKFYIILASGIICLCILKKFTFGERIKISKTDVKEYIYFKKHKVVLWKKKKGPKFVGLKYIDELCFWRIIP